MTYIEMAYLHLGTICPAILIGTYLLLSRKGTPGHKLLGKTYMLLMLVTAITTLFMPAHVGPTFIKNFGFIHVFSLLVLYSVPAAYYAARNGNIAKHKANMVGLYIGGILIAGVFTFMPGRLLHSWFIA